MTSLRTGLLAGVLVLGGVVAGADFSGLPAKAQGTWQAKSWIGETNHPGLHINEGGSVADPERFFDDWVRTLPSDCDLGLMYQSGANAAIACRCPG